MLAEVGRTSWGTASPGAALGPRVDSLAGYDGQVPSPLVSVFKLVSSPTGRKAVHRAVQIARTEEGRKLIAQARKVASSPEGRKLIEQVKIVAKKPTGEAGSAGVQTRLTEIHDRLRRRNR